MAVFEEFTKRISVYIIVGKPKIELGELMRNRISQMEIIEWKCYTLYYIRLETGSLKEKYISDSEFVIEF